MYEKIHSKARILITDDEPIIRNILLEFLSPKYECIETGSAEDALVLLETEKFNLVISDIQMSGISGLEMIPLARKLAPDVCIIMISGLQDIDCAIKTMRAGAFDYITKPFDFNHVESVVAHALEQQSLCLAKKLYENHLEEQVAARAAELRREVKKRRCAEEKVSQMAYYDSLTNLPNLALFKDFVARESSISIANQEISAIIFISIDHFKNISDTLGDAAATQLLRGFAERLTGCIRKTDLAAHFGGGEFALLATNVESAEESVKIVQKIKNFFMKPFDCAGRKLHITASFGLSLAPSDGKDCQTLLKNASVALRQARHNGGDDYRFYKAEMHECALKNLLLANSLRHGLEHNEFCLHYQPQINAESGKLTGTEALVRWRHPELGMIPPLEFIPIAESTGLIAPLGKWILQAACEQNAAWQHAGFPPVRVCVNLSMRQFRQQNFVETVSRILSISRLEPQYLELELTESLLMEDAESGLEMLRNLRNLGIKISIDDFGSGYSSLSYLKNLPIDTLKIDKAFIRDIATDSNNAAIVGTIITLANNLGLKTVAEGIETEEQAKVLSGLGCHEMQGYFFSKPVSAESIESFFKERQSEMHNRFIISRMNEMHLNS